MTKYAEFIKAKIQADFSTAKKKAFIFQFEHDFLTDYLEICIYSRSTDNLLKSVIVHKDVIAGVKSFTALMNAIKDDSLHFKIGKLYFNYLEQSQSNPEDKPQSDEQDGTVVVVIAKDNKTPVKVGCNPTLTMTPVSRPSARHLGGGAGFFTSASPFHQKSHTYGVGVGGAPALALSPP